MIHYVLAAPGAGKSTVAPHLRAVLPGSVVLDWDAFMGAAQVLAGVAIRQAPQTWASYESLVRTIVDQLWPVNIVLLGVCTPQQLSDWPSGEWLLLDCADDERRSRLAPRGNPAETEDAVADASFYRELTRSRCGRSRGLRSCWNVWSTPAPGSWGVVKKSDYLELGVNRLGLRRLRIIQRRLVAHWSVCGVTLKGMDVTELAVENIPRGNLHVSREEFVALWRLAEHIGEVRPADWYVAGVAATCRWLACAAVPSILGGWELARAPATRRSRLAHEELIEAERLEAELQLLRHPGGIEGRPGWLEGIVATLQWAWAGSSAPPLDMPSTNAS